MTEEQQEVVRAKVRAENDNMNEGLAVFWLGRTCPLTQKECGGMHCPWFLVNEEREGNKRIIHGGNCCIPLIASQAGPLADGLEKLAVAAATPAAPSSVIVPR